MGKKKSCSLTEFRGKRAARRYPTTPALTLALPEGSHRFDAFVAVVSPSDSLIPTSCTIATLAWHYTTHRPCHKYLQQVRAGLLKEPGLSPLGFRLPQSSTLIGCFCCALLVCAPGTHAVRKACSPQSPAHMIIRPA